MMPNPTMTGTMARVMPTGVHAFCPIGHASFDDVLGNLDQRAEEENEETLRDAATQLVASTLVLPALESMSNSRLRPSDGPFAQGQAERRFMPLLNTHLADRITKAARFPLINEVVAHTKGSVRA